jgi:hypothetical protein
MIFATKTVCCGMKLISTPEKVSTLANINISKGESRKTLIGSKII